MNPQAWVRMTIAPGVELHLSKERPEMKTREVNAAAERVKELLRQGI